MSDNKRIRVLIVAAHDSAGGAARAVHRIYEVLRDHCGDRLDVTLRVIHKTCEDSGIFGGKPSRSRLEFFEYFLRTRLRKRFPREPYVTDNPLIPVQALYPSGLGREINQLKPDVVMLGWLGNATMSIREIGKLKAPVVWRLSDMWMFSGAELYTDDPRYRLGYSRLSRPQSESGPDVNRETFLRKRRHWRKSRHVICPSRWIADQVKASTLTKGWPTHVIPNPIDSELWSPVTREDARHEHGLNSGDLVVLFGAGGGTRHHHKGADLFLAMLAPLKTRLEESGDLRTLRAVIFGEEAEASSVGGVTVSYLGPLKDRELVSAYSAANVMVVPSRMDNFPSTAVEAQSCATPVVGYHTGGLPDIVEDGVTGKLAEPFSVEALADAVHWVVRDPDREQILGHAARQRAIELWNPATIASQYARVLIDASTESGVR